MRLAIMGCLLAAALPGFACEFPDEGNMPLRRAVTRVEMLPEVHAWTVDLHEKLSARPQFVVRLDQPVWKERRCYWPVEVRAKGELWRSYLVSPDGKSVRPKE
jgi:hypothetical protein